MNGNAVILFSTETVGESSVSSGCWGEDSNHALAGAAHFHVASPALLKNQKAVSPSWLAAFLFAEIFKNAKGNAKGKDKNKRRSAPL